MKKLLVVFLWIITVLLAFFIGLNVEKTGTEIEISTETETETETQHEPINNTEVNTNEFESEQNFDESIVEVPILDVVAITEQTQNGITQRQAEDLCRNVLGETAEENGFPLSYRCISAVSANDKFYYVMDIAWMVNNDHWSYIGNCFVSSDGQEIYDGIVLSGEYEMTELRWSK